MLIGPKTIAKAKSEIEGLLDIHQGSINDAYIQSDHELTINLTLKFQPAKVAGATEVTVGISFVESKVNEKHKIVVDEDQKELFPK